MREALLSGVTTGNGQLNVDSSFSSSVAIQTISQRTAPRNYCNLFSRGRKVFFESRARAAVFSAKPCGRYFAQTARGKCYFKSNSGCRARSLNQRSQSLRQRADCIIRTRLTNASGTHHNRACFLFLSCGNIFHPPKFPRQFTAHVSFTSASAPRIIREPQANRAAIRRKSGPQNDVAICPPAAFRSAFQSNSFARFDASATSAQQILPTTLAICR